MPSKSQFPRLRRIRLAGTGAIFAVRTGRRVAAGELQELRARGLDDGLPRGAFLQGQRVGLEAADQWLALGALLVGVGLLFSVGGAADPQVGWRFGLTFGSVTGFLPAAIFFWTGIGTRLWLTVDGVERSRWPRRSVRWVDVQRIVALRRGTPTSGFDVADAIELQLPPAARGWSRWSGVGTFTIQCRPLEISTGALASIIQERVTSARSRL